MAFCGAVDDVLTEGVLSVKLPDVEVLDVVVGAELWVCRELDEGEGLVAANLPLTIGGCDRTGILWTVSWVGPEVQRVVLPEGEFIAEFAVTPPPPSRSGIICGLSWIL